MAGHDPVRFKFFAFSPSRAQIPVIVVVLKCILDFEVLTAVRDQAVDDRAA